MPNDFQIQGPKNVSCRSVSAFGDDPGINQTIKVQKTDNVRKTLLGKWTNLLIITEIFISLIGLAGRDPLFSLDKTE